MFRPKSVTFRPLTLLRPNGYVIKLVWPFTSNAGRQNGRKKNISGNRCQYEHKGDQGTDGKIT